MRRLLGLLLATIGAGLLVSPPAHGQSAYDLFGSARTSALGYASTALTTTAGLHANPAAGAAHRRRGVTFYAREGFGLSSLRYGAMYTAWPLDWGVFSGGASTFGNDVYRELHYSLGYARRLRFGTSRAVYVGLVGRYYHTRIEEYGSTGAFGLHLGVQVSLLPALQFGAQATNVNAPSLVEDEPLPQTLSIGLQYRANRRVLVVTEAFKDVAFPIAVRGGLEVRPIPLLALRAGATTSPTRFTGGVGIQLDWIRAHLAAEQHPDLGWSPSASIEVQW